MLSAEAQLHTPLRERIERRGWEREDRTGARQQRDARRASAGEREHLSFEVIPPAWWSTVRETASGARPVPQLYRGGATCCS